MSATIVRRSTSSPAWWLFGAGLAFAAWWGLPLIQINRLENHFYGLFWYSMLALGVVVWALAVEQRASASQIERRYALLGLITVWQQIRPVSAFKEIRIEREPSLIGRDSYWVLLVIDDETRHAFAQFRSAERAQGFAGELAGVTGLTLAEEESAGD